jgi:hypothetical protein
MDRGAAEKSARERMREAARKRRQERARLSADILDLVVSGYTHETIAQELKLSVKTVRREASSAIEKRRLDGGAHYVHLQVLRLNKAMRVVDLNLEAGDLKAVEPMLKVIPSSTNITRWAPPHPPRRRSSFPARRSPSRRRAAPRTGQKTAPKPLRLRRAGHGLAFCDASLPTPPYFAVARPIARLAVSPAASSMISAVMSSWRTWRWVALRDSSWRSISLRAAAIVSTRASFSAANACSAASQSCACM